MTNRLNKTSTIEIPKQLGLSIAGPWPAFFFDWSKLDDGGREAILTDVLQGAFGVESEADGSGVRIEAPAGVWKPIAVLGGAWLEEIGPDEDNFFAAVMSQLDGILLAEVETGVVQVIGEAGEHGVVAPSVAALKVGPYRGKDPA